MLDKNHIRLLRETSRFYREVGSEFSETRQHAWPGWERVLNYVPNAPFSLLDVASGNLRFERFLAEKRASFHALALDACPDSAARAPHTQAIQADVLARPLAALTENRTFDLVVSFGFMHHIPDARLRQDFLEQLLSRVAARGHLVVSFWQFGKDPRIAANADEVPARFAAANPTISLEAGDYLLGWRNKSDVFRFCHTFTDQEARQLGLAAAQNLHNIELVDSFHADGKTRNLNYYLVFSSRKA